MTTFIDFTNGDTDVIEFSGSNSKDTMYAKNFWQSIQLHPPLESRLVSSDIKQRMKAAPPGHQSINLAYDAVEQSPKVSEFLARAQVMDKITQFHKIQRLNAFREENRQSLERARDKRKEKESLSNHRGLRQHTDPFIASMSDEEAEDDAQEALQDLDKFDSMRNHNVYDSD